MKIRVGADLEITEISKAEYKKLDDYLKSNLIIENPEYYKLAKMGKWVGNVSSHITLYSKLQNGFLVPFGALRDIYKMFSKADYELDFHNSSKTLNYSSKITPYDYQEEAIQKVLKMKNGILIAPCGAGKTEMALEIVARIGKPALWITHTQDLLQQSMERAEKCFGTSKTNFGTITKGKINIGSHITFSTVQTLCKIDLKKIKNQFDVVIVDECHRVGGSPTNVMMFYKCLSNLSARYKIGVTATPKKNGLEKSMYCLFGELIHEIPKEVVEAKLCQVDVVSVFTSYRPDIKAITNTDGTINHAKCLQAMCEDEKRNNDIIELINKKDLKSCIVLSERVNHLHTLQENLMNKSTAVLTSQTKSNDRKQIIEDFKNGKIDVLFSTYQLMAEGFDCPALKYLVLATPSKNERIVTQSCGRVARKSEGKTVGIIFDFVDNYFLYQNMYKQRQRIYKKNNYNLS